MSTPKGETKLVRSIFAEFAKRKRAGEPIFWFKIHGSVFQRAGLPDIFVVYRGVAMFFECKAPGGKLTALQAKTIGEILAVGGNAAVVESVAEVVFFLERINANN